MKKNSLSRYFLFVTIATFVSIMFVLIQKSYSNIMGPIKVARESALIKPLSSTIPLELIDEIEQKKEYLELDVAENIWLDPNALPTPTVIISPQPTPTTLPTPTI